MQGDVVSLEDLDPQHYVCWIVVYCTKTALPLLPLSSLSLSKGDIIVNYLTHTGDLGMGISCVVGASSEFQGGTECHKRCENQ